MKPFVVHKPLLDYSGLRNVARNPCQQRGGQALGFHALRWQGVRELYHLAHVCAIPEHVWWLLLAFRGEAHALQSGVPERVAGRKRITNSIEP